MDRLIKIQGQAERSITFNLEHPYSQDSCCSRDSKQTPFIAESKLGRFQIICKNSLFLAITVYNGKDQRIHI